MERKRAWVYCAIDAPEDEHETLKVQRMNLMKYAEQMQFDIAGSSSDLGGKPLWKRPGFQRFTEAVKNHTAEILLIDSIHCLSHFSLQLAQFELWVKCSGVRLYSPLMGEIRLNGIDTKST